MFNLLRMDLYRLKRTKSLYICLAFLLAMTILAYWMIWRFQDPEGLGAGEMSLALQSTVETLKSYDLLMMFRDSGIDGGVFTTITGILAALFVSLDFSSGFMKNIMALHRDRWKYVASKLLTAGILNFVFLAALLVYNLLVNTCFGTLVPNSAVDSLAFYFVHTWTVSMGFSALFILVILLTRSSAMGVAAVLVLGSGLGQTLLLNFTALFHMTEWCDYTLYANLAYGPVRYSGMADWKGAVVGLVFSAVYSLLGCIVLTRRDI